MKICLVTEFFYPDGGSTPKLLSELVRRLKDTYLDIEIDVLTSRNLYKEEKKLAAFDDWDGVRITRMPVPATNRLSAPLRLLAGFGFCLFALLRLLSRSRYDLVFVGTNPPASPLVAALYKRLRGVPYVYLIHDLYPDIAVAVGMLSESGKPSKATAKIQRKWLHGGGRVVVLGRCMRDHLIKKYGLPEDNVEVITNWADENEIPTLPCSTRFRAQHGLEDRFVVLYSGNLGYSHGIRDIVDAARIVGERCEDVEFVLVGSGAQKDDIARYIEESRISNAKLFPPVDWADYPDLLASADVALVSLGGATSGLAVPCKFYSHLASGRAVVAIMQESSEVARVVTEAECGVQVDPDDPQKLADALLRLKESRDMVRQMGENARRVLMEKYTLDRVSKQYYEVFQAIIEQGRKQR